ncbi:uncharacterized protein LOC142237138 isoform X2 [Haematobia irritans]|uniref:uncharacterized protein LOC142237138 isoform X2 n=1 Tax=Haematobia irritans TaxID=7368 RepID=UPI003F502B94
MSRIKRSNQGKPSARFDQYLVDMSLLHSPPNTPSISSNAMLLNQGNVSTQPILEPEESTNKQSAGREVEGKKEVNSQKQQKPKVVDSSGLPEQWPTFAESFYNTTDEFQYNNLHNIMRLKESLKGSVRESVECLLGSSENVAAVMSHLKETFGRPEQLIKSQIDKVRKIPRLVNNNLEALVSFANKTSTMATFLKNARVEHHLYNPSLLSELFAKLPMNRQMEWGEKCLSLKESPSVLDFSQWLETLRRVANIVHDTLPYAPNVSTNRRQTTNPSRKFACVAVKNCVVCEGVCTSVGKCKQFIQISTDEKWEKIKNLKVCFCCLKKGHQLRDCRNKIACGKDDFQKFHHVLLHNEVATEVGNSSAVPQPEQRICHAVGETDDGANVSMVDSKIANELDLQGKKQKLSLQWLNEHCVAQNCEVIEMTISGVGAGDKRYTMKNVYTTSNLSLPIQSCSLQNLVKLPLDVPRILSAAGPIATTTRLGVMVYGPTAGTNPTTTRRALHARRYENKEDDLQSLNVMMKNYFDMESLGVKITTTKLIPADDERALKLLNEFTREVGGRYECRLLWKENIPPFPESYEMALKRLYCVEKKMARDSEYSRVYCQKINDYLSKGYTRKIEENEKPVNNGRVFYLPHFGVQNINKKGIRIVFDAAAEVHNISLNKCLLSGPDINNTLISTIFKFREAPIAVCGYIKEMFHQVKIAKIKNSCGGMETRIKRSTFM